MSERFESDWLKLRETADSVARDRVLTARTRDWLAGRSAPFCITDLGTGGGANPRFLAAYLPGPQRWRLIDRDAELLALAGRRLARTRDADGNPIHHDARRQHLADIDAALVEDTDLATASALFDLVSAEWIEALAARCAAIGCAALWTLSIDGAWHFIGPDGGCVRDDTDAAMRSLMHAHQTRDKGLGPALGGAAPGALAAAFVRHGYSVTEAPSPWRLLPGADQPLALALLDGWQAALLEQAPEEGPRIEYWRQARRAGIEAGELGIEVGHIDLYAEPPE